MIKKERIESIKNSIDLKDYISRSTGSTFKKAGKSYLCRCPFPGHVDKTPSFSVTPEKQMFKCFGCHVGGDIFTFIKQYEGLGFVEAIKKLEKQCI